MRNKIENTEQENRRGFPSQAFSLPRCFQPSRISAVSFHTRLITFFYRKLPGLPPDLEEAAEGATEMRNKRKMNETMGRRGSRRDETWKGEQCHGRKRKPRIAQTV